jgi:hypothetical protein
MTEIQTLGSDTGSLTTRMPRLAAPGCPGCPKCSSHELAAAMAPPGHRERAAYLRCRHCGLERDDLELTEFF